jgi:RNA recognition motif-containing protein
MEQEVNKNKLYVGGINYDTQEDALKAHFEQAGTVEEAIIIIDKRTGRSKGFGFVTMGSEEEAKKAVEMFDGKEFEGRSLTVNEARPQKKRFEGEGGFGDGSNDRW